MALFDLREFTLMHLPIALHLSPPHTDDMKLRSRDSMGKEFVKLNEECLPACFLFNRRNDKGMHPGPFY